MSTFDEVFNAVFPAPSEVETPTPAATPVLGCSSFGAPFGSPQGHQTPTASSASEQIKWDRCWHIATSFLALPDEPVTPEPTQAWKARDKRPVTSHVREATEYVVRQKASLISQNDNLMRWYFEDVVVTHYKKHVLPPLCSVSAEK